MPAHRCGAPAAVSSLLINEGQRSRRDGCATGQRGGLVIISRIAGVTPSNRANPKSSYAECAEELLDNERNGSTTDFEFPDFQGK